MSTHTRPTTRAQTPIRAYAQRGIHTRIQPRLYAQRLRKRVYVRVAEAAATVQMPARALRRLIEYVHS